MIASRVIAMIQGVGTTLYIVLPTSTTYYIPRPFGGPARILNFERFFIQVFVLNLHSGLGADNVYSFARRETGASARDGGLKSLYFRIRIKNSFGPFSKKLNLVKPPDLREAAGNTFLYLPKQRVFRI